MISLKACFELDNEIRSCGRFGPEIEGTTSAKSSSTYSENRGSTLGSCQSPFRFAYFSTSSICSGARPVSVRYRNVSLSIGKIAQVDPYSGDIFPIAVRLAIGKATTPGP